MATSLEASEKVTSAASQLTLRSNEASGLLESSTQGPTLEEGLRPMVDVIPGDELERLAAVQRYDVLDTPPDGAIDRITALAARLLKVPVAIVSIVDADRIWFKSHHGSASTRSTGSRDCVPLPSSMTVRGW